MADSTDTKTDTKELMRLIQEADAAALVMERARFAVEAAKAALDAAKEKFDQARAEFDETLAQADAIGVPRAKIKKLIEDRTSALMASGLIVTSEEKVKAARTAKPAKKVAKPDAEAASMESNPVSEAEIHYDADVEEPAVAMEL